MGSLRRVKQLLLRDIVTESTAVGSCLLGGADVLASDGWRGNSLGHFHGGFLLVLQDSVHLVGWQVSHRGSITGSLNTQTLARELYLVEEAQGSATLFFHDLVDELAVEAHVQFAKGVLD